MGQKRKRESSSWSDLPEDISRLIIEKLFLVDRVRFREVCSGWRIPIKGIPTIDRLPWVLSHSWYDQKDGSVLSVCKLSDPYYNQTFTLKDQIRKEERKSFSRAQVCESKHGWLLLAKNFKRSTLFFLFTPFTNEIIKLPTLRHRFDVATFSSKPNSDKCVFFVAHRPRRSIIMISTCCRGDQRWRSKIFSGDFWTRLQTAVCVEGIFYCAFGCGMLGAFSVASRDWRMLVNFDLVLYATRNLHMVEANGILLLAGRRTRNCGWVVFRFDWSERSWIREKSLGYGALFVGRPSSLLVSTTGVPIDLADKIFHCDFGMPYNFYSLENKEYGCSEIYGSDSETRRNRIWIELPH